jgi:hypothetical protein
MRIFRTMRRGLLLPSLRGQTNNTISLTEAFEVIMRGGFAGPGLRGEITVGGDRFANRGEIAYVSP